MSLALEEKIIRELTHPQGNICAGDLSGPYTPTFEYIYGQAARSLDRVLRNNELAVNEPIAELIAWAQVLCLRVKNADSLREAFDGLYDVIRVHIDTGCKADFITDKLRRKHPDLIKLVENKIAISK